MSTLTAFELLELLEPVCAEFPLLSKIEVIDGLGNPTPCGANGFMLYETPVTLVEMKEMFKGIVANADHFEIHTCYTDSFDDITEDTITLLIGKALMQHANRGMNHETTD